MFGKLGNAFLLIAIVVSTLVAVFVVRQISLSQQKLTISDPSFINYLVQFDHITDKLAGRLDDVIDASPENRAGEWVQARREFDILWSLLKVSDIWRPGDDSNVAGTEQLTVDGNAFLTKYDTLFLEKSPPDTQNLTTALVDLNLVSRQLHPVGVAFFQQWSFLENELQYKLERMYRYLIGAGLLMFLSIGVLVYQLYSYSKRRQSLFEEAEAARKQLAIVIEELRSGKRERKAKDSFLAAASHDLRQPLHALGLFVNALDNKVSTPDGPVILEKIRQSTEALNSLFNSLLDISKLDAGVVEVTPSHFFVNTLFESVEESYREVALQKNLRFSMVHNNQVAHTDYLLLLRIVSNLIDNAVVHTESGEISVRCVERSDRLEIAVTDTGPGIPDSEQNSIFSEYYQLKNPERDRSKGLGLGLSIVKRLTDLLEVDIALKSKVGQGSTFTVRLDKGDPAKVVVNVDVGVDAKQLDLRGCTVLIIDDEKEVREAMELMLRDANSVALSAESAESARDLVVENDVVPALIIADYRLREGRTGDEAIELVRDELNKDIPAIIITGDTSPERVRLATESGFALLHKPVAPDELISTIASLVVRHGPMARASA